MKNKKGLKIFLIILAVIVTLTGGVCIWQWDNIKAVSFFLKYSKEELEEMNKENDKKLDDAVANLELMPRELTDEEKKALEVGEITEEDAIEITLGKVTLEEKIKEKENPGKAPTKVEEAKTDRVSELIAKLYVLKSTYISKLDGLAADAKAEYKATPEAERTEKWKSSKISKYMSLATSLEATCDAQVEAIVTELRTELKKTGGDMSLIDTVRSSYESEKQIKKAFYLNKYLK